jgi:hypothetical protein
MDLNGMAFTPNFSEVGQLINLFKSRKGDIRTDGYTHTHGHNGDFIGLFCLLRKKSTLMRVETCTPMENIRIFAKCVLCQFVCLIGFDVVDAVTYKGLA